MATMTVLGKLGKDVEVKSVNGTTLAKFSIAENVGFGDTIWYDVSLWGKQAESKLIDYLNKGTQVHVSGEFSQREYNGKQYNGIRVYDLKLCGGKQEAQPQQAQPPQQPKPTYAKNPAPQQNSYKPQNGGGELDDDLPFAPIHYSLT